jgi:hypothetical protein
MCTLTWTAARRGYELFFNRDELNSRAAETPPELGRCEGVAYIAPRDGQSGGTWILANEFGLTVCLLNDYGAAWRPVLNQSRVSRGAIVRACAAATTHDEVVDAVQAQPLAATPAFQLVAFSPEEGPLFLHWRGAQLVRCETAVCAPPISSSSYATEEVIARRIGQFSASVRSPRNAEPAELAAFHRQHAPSSGAHSVLMRRDDASTRSIIHVTVAERSVRLDYQPVRWTVSRPVMLAPTRLMLSRRRAMVAA